MKTKLLLSALILAATAPIAISAEQILVQWNKTWKYFHTMSDDPTLDDALIDNSGAGIAPNTGPDLIHTGMNAGIGAWFAKESDFIGPGGYSAVFGKGFNIDGTKVGDNTIYSTYDGGQGPGPLGYATIDYFLRTDIVPEMSAFGTTLTTTPTTRRFAAYFRTTFTVTQDFAKPRVRMLLDDSAVIYYDGVAVARVNRDNSNIAYDDVAATDTTANNNEEGLAAGNETTIQSFFLDQPGGPGKATVTPGATADSFVTVAVPKIATGTHTLAIIVRNSGNNSSDLCMGLQLLGDDAGISAAAGVATRNFMGTADPNDDTFSVPVTVTKTGTTATSWTSNDAGHPSGAFNVVTSFGPYPVSAAVTINFTSVGHTPPPELTTSLTLIPPFLLGVNSLTPSPTVITFPSSPPWTEVPGRSFLQLNNSGALSVQDTDPIALAAGTPKCITIALEYNDNSTGSNAETEDSVKVELVTDVGTFNLTSAYDSDGTSNDNGSAMNGESDAAQTSGDELNPDSLPVAYTYTSHWLLAGVIPSTATTVTVRVTGINNSGSETLRFGSIQLKACVDTDGDGVLDIWEEVAGTDPNNAASNFREISHAVTSTTASITVSSVVGRTYQLYSSSDLTTWIREAVPATPPAVPFEANTPGTGSALTLVRPHTNPARMFWRAVVHLPTTDIVSP